MDYIHEKVFLAGSLKGNNKLKPSGGDLFIVDNSLTGWTGIKYLEQWTEISTSFDIATGYFETGALLALDGHWQKLEKIRVLMGDETTHRTKRLFLEALKTRANFSVDSDLELIKNDNPNYSFVYVENNPININFVYENYLKKYSEKIDKDLIYIDYDNNSELPDNVWLIYFTDITNEKFVKPNKLNNYKVKSNIIFNHLELYQLKKIN